MAKDDNDAVFCARKLRENVADGKLPFRRVSDKGVVFDLIAFKMVDDIALKLFVILAADVARTEGGHLACVLKGALRIDRGPRRGCGYGKCQADRRQQKPNL